jgi:plastocyanin
MTVRRQIIVGVAGILGAAVAVLPAIAGSETISTIDAVNVPAGLYSEEQHHWQPAVATIAPGGTVTFSNSSRRRRSRQPHAHARSARLAPGGLSPGGAASDGAQAAGGWPEAGSHSRGSTPAGTSPTCAGK